MTHAVGKVVSGGQTGVDRAALDAAIELSIPHGGWCPRGRLAEDGAIAPRYQLSETESSDYSERTERNVIDSDATLIVARGPLTGGTLLTERLARRHGRACLVLDLDGVADVDAARAWLAECDVQTLNIAGPRESTSPGIYVAARALLAEILRAGS